MLTGEAGAGQVLGGGAGADRDRARHPTPGTRSVIARSRSAGVELAGRLRRRRRVVTTNPSGTRTPARRSSPRLAPLPPATAEVPAADLVQRQHPRLTHPPTPSLLVWRLVHRAGTHRRRRRSPTKKRVASLASDASAAAHRLAVMRNAWIRYRIMAYIVGCLLVVLVCVGPAAEVPVRQPATWSPGPPSPTATCTCCC